MAVRALLPLAVVAALAVTAAAAAPVKPTQRRCGDKAVTVLFWPKGHGVVRSLGFPESRAPHLELFRYAGAQTYRPPNQIGFVESKGPVKLAARCKAVSLTASSFPGTRPSKAPAVASCSVPSGLNVQTQKIGSVGWDVRMVDPPKKVVLRATITPTGSALYTTQQCRIGKAPT